MDGAPAREDEVLVPDNLAVDFPGFWQLDDPSGAN